MARKGYQLLNTDIFNSDQDEEDEQSPLDASNRPWSAEGGENLDIFASPAQNDSSKSNESVELRSRNSGGQNASASSTSSRPKSGNGNNGNNNGVILLERRVRKDDTVQKVSLQFGISVAELKRVNGFLADSDLFAREIIKIPVRKYGYNHALIMAELDGDTSTACVSKQDVAAGAATSSQGTVEPSSPTEPARAERLLQTVDANIQKAQRQLEQRQQSGEGFNSGDGLEDDRMLDLRYTYAANSNGHGAGPIRLSKRYIRNCLGVIVVVSLLIGIPLIYLVYKFGGQIFSGRE